MFEGFSEETIRFFLELRYHNDVTFFKEHEEEYRAFVREPFYAFIEAMAPTASKLAPDMELRPNKCLARIRRDIRFTKDKSPFRDHLWLLFRRSGEDRQTAAMYWFELSPETCEWGLGFWGDNRPAMDLLRKKLREKPGEVSAVLKRCKLPDQRLCIFGEPYKRMAIPEGLPSPLDRIYPMKSLYIKRIDVPSGLALTPGLVDTVAADLTRLKPMYELLRGLADQAMAELDP